MKQNKIIAEPWIAEVEFKFNTQYYSLSSVCDDTNVIMINLVNIDTGEIRQKQVTIDQIARRCFESEIKNWEDIKIEDNI